MKNIIQDYKMTPLGLIPLDWDTKKLSDIFEFKNGLNKEKIYFGEGSPIVNYVDVYKNRQINGDMIYGKVKVTKSEKERFDVKVGDVFFTRTSETINEIGYSSVIVNPQPDTVFSGFVLRAREKSSTLDNLYKKYCFSTHLARKEIITKSSMTTRALTSGSLLGDVFVIVPPLIEQKKIAKILSTWDDAINVLNKQLDYQKTYRSGLMKSMVLKHYTEQKKLSNNLRLKKYLTFQNETVLDRNIEPVSVGVNGIRLRSEIYTKELSSDYSKNKVIRENNLCFGIGTNNIVYDILFENKTYCVSPAYKVFTINGIDPFYLKCYLDTFNEYYSKKYMIISARQGKSVDMDGLLNERIYVPSFENQISFSNAMKSIDELITILNRQVEFINLQKKGLMQQLLTGKIRVNVN